VQTKKEQKDRGNYLSYAFRATEIMQEPAIKRQVRRHWLILRNAMKKRGCQNLPLQVLITLMQLRPSKYLSKNT